MKYNEEVLIFLAFRRLGLVGRITYLSIKCFLVVPFSSFLAFVKTSISLHSQTLFFLSLF